MNNNSRKSSKNTSSKSSKARKNSKKNFKIENLEPRLMMDAATSFEVEKLDAYAEQFESLSATIGDEVTKAIDSISSFDISSLGISEKIDSVTSLLSDSAEKFKGIECRW
ncbi:MAG: LEPR-XLL domain-containing protein [Fibrobacter sp.]|nr:LEPR-XLL domain-containing protein [Fibrobacter sp.]